MIYKLKGSRMKKILLVLLLVSISLGAGPIERGYLKQAIGSISAKDANAAKNDNFYKIATGIYAGLSDADKTKVAAENWFVAAETTFGKFPALAAGGGEQVWKGDYGTGSDVNLKKYAALQTPSSKDPYNVEATNTLVQSVKAGGIKKDDAVKAFDEAIKIAQQAKTAIGA